MTAIVKAVDAPTLDGLETVLLEGDLSKLTQPQRIQYYQKVCESTGLNPLTQPFEYLKLNGKLVLYAKRGATDQLRKIHNVSVTITARERIDDLYVVTARATMPDGRCDENIGAVTLKGLSGEALANALMKGETKAKRRVTLAICGLSMLDETEVESIPQAQRTERLTPQDRLDAIANDARGGEPRPLASASAGGPALTAKAEETGSSQAALPTGAAVTANAAQLPVASHATAAGTLTTSETNVDAIDELVTRYNMAAKAAAEFANLPFTGECDEIGCMVPPNPVPAFESGPHVGKRYDDAKLIGKVRAMAATDDFKDRAPPHKQVHAAYWVTRHEVLKLLKEQEKENATPTL